MELGLSGTPAKLANYLQSLATVRLPVRVESARMKMETPSAGASPVTTAEAGGSLKVSLRVLVPAGS